jgi:outer membrane protein OmpA-like peptidoglycan-associated protein
MRLALALLAAAATAQADAADRSAETDGCPGAWVFFDLDSARLDDRARRVLAGSAEEMRQLVAAGAWLNIIGSTDTSGSAAHNLALSRQRAGQVRDYFLGRGFPAVSLRVIANGESGPGWSDPGTTPALRRRLDRNVQVHPEMPRAVFERFFPPGGPIC